MHSESLVKMANQIGGFFAAMPDHDEAVADIATHLKKFWEPRMRKALLAHADATGTESGLDGIVAEAVSKHRGMLG